MTGRGACRGSAERSPARPACRVIEHVLEVRPSDIDAAGHLNHVAMVRFLEHGRVRAHRDVRRRRPELPDMRTVVRHLAIDYLGQASAFDELTIRTWVRRDGRTSRTWAQELVRPDGQLVARAEVISVLLDARTGRPAPLPEVYREVFAEHCEQVAGGSS